jgi:hypothetical protein
MDNESNDGIITGVIFKITGKTEKRGRNMRHRALTLFEPFSFPWAGLCRAVVYNEEE